MELDDLAAQGQPDAARQQTTRMQASLADIADEERVSGQKFCWPRVLEQPLAQDRVLGLEVLLDGMDAVQQPVGARIVRERRPLGEQRQHPLGAGQRRLALPQFGQRLDRPMAGNGTAPA